MYCFSVLPSSTLKKTRHVCSHMMAILATGCSQLSSTPGTNYPLMEETAASKFTLPSAAVEGQLTSSEWWKGWSTKALMSF